MVDTDRCAAPTARDRAAFSSVEDDAVALSDETGKSSSKTVRVEAGGDPRRIAAMLKCSTMQQSDFNRAIHYGPPGVA